MIQRISAWEWTRMNREWNQDHLREVKTNGNPLFSTISGAALVPLSLRIKGLSLNSVRNSVRGIREKAQLEGASQCWSWPPDSADPYWHPHFPRCWGSIYPKCFPVSKPQIYSIPAAHVSGDISFSLFTRNLETSSVHLSMSHPGPTHGLPTLTTNFLFPGRCPFLATSWAVLELWPLNLLLIA